MASTQLDSKKRLALAIVDFLNTSLKDGTLQKEDAESIEIATSCIADTFHVDPANKTQMADAIGSQNLLSIYGVYEKLKGKSSASTAPGASSASEGRPSTPSTAASNSNKKGDPTVPNSGSSASVTTPESESLKSQGNAAMARKDYASAILRYSKPIDISPANPIYLSNRAAAYSAEHKHTEAVADAEMAVAADPKYTKAWSRLGLARFVLGDARGSMEAYEKGIEAEGKGGSEAMKKGYRTAKEKVDEQEREGQAAGGGMAEDVDDAPGASRAGAGGMPDLSALAGMMGGGGGGMPDMASIMNNPMFASMAQNLMQNPQALQGLMNNPQLRGLAERFGGGGGGAGGAGAGGEAGAGAGAARGAGAGAGTGGGMPDLSSLMNDPSIAEMARNMMGGGAGAGRGRGGGGGGA